MFARCEGSKVEVIAIGNASMSTSEFTKCTLLMFVKQWNNNTVKQSKTYLKAREKAKQAELFLNIFCFRRSCFNFAYCLHII